MKNFIRSLFGLGKPREPAVAAPTAKQAETSRMLAGIVDEAARLDALDAARGKEAVVVRLQEQVPLRDVDQPRSWLGGGPAMATDIAWPVADGEPTMFLAQICCADLPADLWDGLGPRDGWLVIFFHAKGVVVKHLTTLGPWRERPETNQEDLWFPFMVRRAYPGATPITTRPRWPVDPIAVRPGSTDPIKLGRSNVLNEIYTGSFDAASAEHRPFDWNSTLQMMAMIEAGIAERIEAMTRDERKKATSEEGRARSQALRVQIEAVLPKLNALGERVRAISAPSDDEIGAIMAELGAIMVPDRQGALQPLTHHPAASWLWVWNFDEWRRHLARYAYSRDPDVLPEATRAYCETIWRDIAEHEMASAGHIPFGNVDDFDPATDVTLLELPSNDLVGWRFGDLNSLVLCISKDDLAAGRFDRVRSMTTYY